MGLYSYLGALYPVKVHGFSFRESQLMLQGDYNDLWNSLGCWYFWTRLFLYGYPRVRKFEGSKRALWWARCRNYKYL